MEDKPKAHQNKKVTREIVAKLLANDSIKEGNVIIVGFSGGPDSLCLLHSLREVSDLLNLELVPVHINHNLRGEKSKAEERHAIELCEKMGLDYVVYSADCAGEAEDLGVSLEEAGRIIRYEIFDEVAYNFYQNGVPEDNIRIAVAHNADDQSETVLFRLMRGTGVHGLAGISASRLSNAGFEIIRPILDVTREDVECYIAENKLRPNMDESNQVADVSRNKIRLKLLPYIEENFNPNIKEALRRCAESASVDDDFMEEYSYIIYSSMLLEVNDKEIQVVDISDIDMHHVAIIRRIAMHCLRALEMESDARYDLVMALVNLFFSNNPSASINLPKGVIARREYDKVIFYVAEENETASAPSEAYELSTQILPRREFEPINEEIFAAFDYDAFSDKYPGKVGDIVLRTRREGDFIAIKGGKSKKLQDYFVDAKIAQSERDSILLVAIGSEVLWIVPNDKLPTASQQRNGRFSQNYQLTNTSERVLFIELLSAI